MSDPICDIFSSLYQSSESGRLALDMQQRIAMPIIAVVTVNDDPGGMRRIKVSDPAMPRLNSDWIRRAQGFPGFDPPLPAIGSTVLCWFVDGDPSNGWYQQCVNLTNPPQGKSSSLNDWHLRVPGEHVERTEGNHTLRVGQSLRLETDAGSFIELAADGSIVVSDGVNSFNIADSGISFATGSLQVGSEVLSEIATVGATDTRGDDLVDKGWS